MSNEEHGLFEKTAPVQSSTDDSDENLTQESDSESLNFLSSTDIHSSEDEECRIPKQNNQFISPEDFDSSKTQSRYAKCGIYWSENQLQPTPTICSNILNFNPGPASFVKAPTKKTAFSYFMSDDILQEICNCTNREARYISAEKNLEWKDIEVEEMEAFIGMLVLAGVDKNWDVPIQELFSGSDVNPYYRATMSLNRFKTIKRFLRFDDKRTRPVRRQQDKLAVFSSIWNVFTNNCRRCYVPSANVTIDEQLLPVGTSSFSSKPERSKIKIFWMCDSATSYAIDGIIYCGRQPKEKPHENLSHSIVSQLTSSIDNTDRNVTMNSFFTCIPLAETLLKKRLTTVGTVNHNKPEVPQCMKPSKSRQVYSSVFGFYKDHTMVSYIPKKNRNIIVLSTMHRDATVEEGPKKKPEIVMHYNATKGGVDSMDQMARMYTCRRQTRRWSFVLFMNCIDIAAINAFVVYTTLNNNYHSQRSDRRRLFLKDLAKELITPHLLSRSKTVYHPHIKEALKLCGVQLSVPMPQQPTKRRRCAFCSCSKDRKTSTACQNCNKPICGEHSYHLCQDCI